MKKDNSLDFHEQLKEIRKKITTDGSSKTKKPDPKSSIQEEKKILTENSTESESFADLLANSDNTHASIKRIAPSNKHPHFDKTPPPSRTKARALVPTSHEDVPAWLVEADELPDEMLTLGESISYSKPGYPNSYIKKLRKGFYRIEFTIDLHGYYLKEASHTIHKLINVAKSNHHSVIRVIHGKGRHSSNKGPVIKTMLNHQLRLRDDVIAFCTAPQHDGGTGVLYCLLKL